LAARIDIFCNHTVTSKMKQVRRGHL